MGATHCAALQRHRNAAGHALEAGQGRVDRVWCAAQGAQCSARRGRGQNVDLVALQGTLKAWAHGIPGDPFAVDHYDRRGSIAQILILQHGDGVAVMSIDLDARQIAATAECLLDQVVQDAGVSDTHQGRESGTKQDNKDRIRKGAIHNRCRRCGFSHGPHDGKCHRQLGRQLEAKASARNDVLQWVARKEIWAEQAGALDDKAGLPASQQINQESFVEGVAGLGDYFDTTNYRHNITPLYRSYAASGDHETHNKTNNTKDQKQQTTQKTKTKNKNGTG